MIIGISVTFVFIIDAWANSSFLLSGLLKGHHWRLVVFIYPAAQAPNYPVGYKAAAAFAVACMGFTALFTYLCHRYPIEDGVRDPMPAENEGEYESKQEELDIQPAVLGQRDWSTGTASSGKSRTGCELLVS
jgi:hypothetical protein